VIGSRHKVTFTADNGLIVQVALDMASAHMTGGFGGWEVVDRPKRVALTRFKGKDPYRMDVPILFDGWSDDASQEVQISTLARMSEQPAEQQPPPTLTVDGAVPRDDLTWVIETIDWDGSNVIWDMQNGVPVRLRQSAVVHLLQYVDDNVIITKATPAVKNGGNKRGGKTVTTTSASTLRQTSQAEYDDPDAWKLIGDANGIFDPRAPILPGTTLYIPPKNP
jgi:hypothetical protein